MTHSVKKIATAKNIPLLALALFAAMFMGSEVLASMKVQEEDHWLYEATPECTETNEGCYVKLENDEELNDECLEIDNEVCGIVAPDNSGQPLIQGELRTDLESGNFQDNPNIFTMPRTN